MASIWGQGKHEKYNYKFQFSLMLRSISSSILYPKGSEDYEATKF